MTAQTYTDLDTSARILLGPGPSTVHPRVLARWPIRWWAASTRSSSC
jgi:hypothetical protein